MEKNKKNILLVIRRGASEIEWIAPIIKRLNFKYNLYTFYLTEKSYQNCKSDKLSLSVIKKYQTKEFIQKKRDKFLYKIARKILPEKYFFNKMSGLIHDTRYLKMKLSLKKNEKIDIILTEFGNYNQWLYTLKKKEFSKIIHFPSTPAVYVNDRNFKTIPKKLPGDYLIVNTKKDKIYWSKFISKKKIYHFGVPFFESDWQKYKKNYEKFDIKKNGKKLILFAYSSYFGHVNRDEFRILEEQLHGIMKILSRIKNVKVFFKIHPHKNDEYFLKIINNYKKNLRILTKKNLNLCARKCDCLISNFQSAASLYGALLKKPSIEMWKGISSIYKTDISNNSKLSLVEKTKNLIDFERKLLLAINRSNSSIWKKNYYNFNKLYLNNNTSREIVSFIKNV